MNFEAMLLSQINDVEIEPEIIKIAEDLKNTSLFPNLSDEDYNRVLDLAVQTLNTRYGESYIVKTDTKSDPWFNNYYKDLGITRWDRYVDYLKQQKKFAPKVINGMQENLFKIIDLVGNPSGENFSRRGLVIGDVQSGKTANYVGLMNLATDAKFKLMIVLTGTTNTLREQTQIRIEEGLGKANLKKGVSVVQDIRYEDFEKSNPIYLTSEEHDFNLNSRKNFQLSIETTKVPIVIVTKKNSTALKNIYNWLEEYSLDQRNNRIDSSLLLIDDEADFASVNTKDDEDNPTIINSRIRQILGLFTKSSYLGFTATPYANIFINPEKYEWETYNQILLHEKIHIEQKHTIDLLLAEAVIIFQWFNPFAWQWRKALESNLEFLTDSEMLQQETVEKESYQFSQLKVAAPHFPLSLTTNYNQSLIKKRIIMMNSKKSNVNTTWKYFFLLPLLVLFACLFNQPVAQGQTPNLNELPKVQSNIQNGMDTEGSWFAVIKGATVHIQFRNDYGDNSSTTFQLSELTGFTKDMKGEFTITREAGTMNFEGKFEGNNGMGSYTFKANKNFNIAMAQE